MDFEDLEKQLREMRLQQRKMEQLLQEKRKDQTNNDEKMDSSENKANDFDEHEEFEEDADDSDEDQNYKPGENEHVDDEDHEDDTDGFESPKTKTKQQEKNPLGLTTAMVKEKLAKGVYVLGPPPKNEKATANYWGSFLFFIFDAKSKKVIRNWYGCKCGWVTNTIRQGGTGVLNNHVNRHDTQVMKFSRDELAEYSHLLTSYGDMFGTISSDTFKKLMPPAKAW